MGEVEVVSAGDELLAAWGTEVAEVANTLQLVGSVMLAADDTINSATPADITGMGWPVVSGRSYVFRCHGAYKAANTAQGLGFGFRHPGGSISNGNVRVFGVTSATVEAIERLTQTTAATDDLTSGATVSSADAYFPFEATFLYRATADGTFQLRKKRNGANTTSPGITISAGMSMLVHQSAIS